MKKILSSLIMFSMIFSLVGTVSFNFGEKQALAISPAVVDLGSAEDYAVLAKTAITTTGTSSIIGDVGISPALSSDTSGFALVLDGTGTFATSSQVTGNVYAADYTAPTPSVLSSAVSDMEAAYTDANGRATTVLNVGAGNLAGLNLVAGVYTFDGSGDVSISDDVTLTGSADDVWIFQIPGNLDISASKEIVLSGGAISSNIFWAVAGTTTLHENSVFLGNILAGPGASTIAMENGARLNGRALGQTDVTLIANIISEEVIESDPPQTAKVTIVKYLDGVMATPESANETAFSMHAVFPGGEGNYALEMNGYNNPNPYYATTSDMPIGSDYSTYENIDATVGTSCATTPYMLSGYSTGNTLAEAIAGTQSTTTPAFTDLSSDKFVIVWNEDCANVEPPMCEADENSTTYVSDVTTTEGGLPAVAVATPLNAGWTAVIPGATWIWGEDPQADYVNEVSETFTKTFNVVGTPTGGNLMIAADNSYSVLLNGEALCADTTLTNFKGSGQDVCTIGAEMLNTGLNTLAITVKNQAFPNGTKALNPAGLLYKLTVDENACTAEGNLPPVANANINQSIILPANSATLNSSLSTDSDGSIVSYEWNFVSGPSVINPDDVENPTITGLVEGTYVFEVKVTDNDGAMDTDTVTIVVSGTLACEAGLVSGWDVDYYNYLVTDEGMNLPFSQWYQKSLYGNPLSADNTFVTRSDAWTANWYDAEFYKYSQVESDLMFGAQNFFPFDEGVGLAFQNESLSVQNIGVDNNGSYTLVTNPNGKDYHFGLHATGYVTAPTAGAYAYTMTSDDDLWIYVNGVLVIDNSGVHGVPGDATLTSGTIPLLQGANKVELFFAERHAVQSALNFQFTNLLVVTTTLDCPPPVEQGENTTHTTVVKMADLAPDFAGVISDPTKWFFYNDENDTINNSLGSFVTGPMTALIGTGSAEMTVTGTERKNIATYQFKNVKLSDITDLSFATYSQLIGDGALGLTERAPYLHFNVDFNNSDTWQKRLVYVPAVNGVVTADTWQTWNTTGTALWTWSGYAAAGNMWPDGNTNEYRTWDAIVLAFPNAETRSTDSWFGIRVGEPYANGFTGNVDKFVIGIQSGLDNHVETYDFEPTVTEPTRTAKVTIVKYVDGVMATGLSTDNRAFSMHAIFPGGEGNYDLDADGFSGGAPYSATTSDMAIGSNYSTYENIDATVGTSCATTPYMLSGYSTGNTLAEAIAGTQSTTTPAFTDLSSDKFVIVWNEDCANVEPPMCEADENSTTYVSDVTTTEGGDASVLVATPVNPAWTASIPGASWIWNQDPVANTTDEVITFTKTFSIVGTPTDGQLMIGADNSYEVIVNGQSLAIDTSETNFSLVSQDTYTIQSEMLNTGVNTIEFKVLNIGIGSESNPGGLLYKLIINENACTGILNLAPVANANIDQAITLPTDSTTLNGTLSTDADGSIVSYEWNFVSGPSTINPADTVSPNIAGLVAGTYVFELKVTDNDGAMDTDTVTVTVNPILQENSPNRRSSSGGRRSSNNGGIGGEGEVLGAATDLCNLSIDTYMRVGYQNNPDQVQTLKNFLNWYMNSGLVVNGIYDFITANAVSAFQMKHADKILTPWGLTGPTGIFYKTTLVEAKNKMCPEVILPIPTDLTNWSQNQNQVPSKI